MKTPVTSITLDRAEGDIINYGSTVTISGPNPWGMANAVLAQWATTMTEEEYINKCDCAVLYEDGESYGGTYELQHHDRNGGNLSMHMVGFVRFYADNAGATDYTKHWTHFAATYDMGPADTAKPARSLLALV